MRCKLCGKAITLKNSYPANCSDWRQKAEFRLCEQCHEDKVRRDTREEQAHNRNGKLTD